MSHLKHNLSISKQDRNSTTNIEDLLNFCSLAVENNNSTATLKPLTFMRHVSVLHTTSAETGIAHWDRRKLCPASATASATASTSRRTLRGQRAMRLDIGMGLLHRPDAVATGTSGICICMYVCSMYSAVYSIMSSVIILRILAVLAADTNKLCTRSSSTGSAQWQRQRSD